MKNKFRSIWISDVHLGYKYCNASYLLNFLKSIDCDYLYLVGDFIDFERMPKGWHWPLLHSQVLQLILDKSVKGTRVIYIPGNHDELVRDYIGLSFGEFTIKREAIHETVDGRRFWVIHGDEFDGVVRCGRLLNWIGEKGYDLLLFFNRQINAIRRRRGLPYWSLANSLKSRIGKSAGYIARFEITAAQEAARRGLDGVICGHIHKAAVADIDGVLYCNDGDWVESCTALVERQDGALEILHRTDEAAPVAEGQSLSKQPALTPGWVSPISSLYLRLRLTARDAPGIIQTNQK